MKIRRIEHIINQTTFHAVYSACPLDKREGAIKLIESKDVDGLLRWIKKNVEEDIGEYNIRTLRWIAATMHIPKYSFMNKGDLLSEIIAREKARTTTEVH